VGGVRLAVIGLGEVGRVVVEDAAPGSVTGWDIAFLGPRSAATPGHPALRNAAELGLPTAVSLADVVGGADVVISAVTAANTVIAADAVAPAIRPGAFFADLNSSSPARKQAAAAAIEAAGGRYVEVAVMSPIHPHRLAAPMLLGGPHAADFAAVASGLGFSATTVYAASVGRAAATKLCRSVLVKGLEALLTESMLAARAYGVESEVLDSMSNIVPGVDWPELAQYMVSRAVEHGVRRAEEMREAAETVREAGVQPWMALATANRQDHSGWFRDIDTTDLFAMIDVMRALTRPASND
jgi:3-hydroxyisobutyrate dehydrogenase-like beta-hydroxyacid dehydrogenase